MISEVLRPALGAQHPLILVLLAAIQAISVHSPQINKQNVQSLLHTQLRKSFKVVCLSSALFLIIIRRTFCFCRCFILGCLLGLLLAGHHFILALSHTIHHNFLLLFIRLLLGARLVCCGGRGSGSGFGGRWVGGGGIGVREGLLFDDVLATELSDLLGYDGLYVLFGVEDLGDE